MAEEEARKTTFRGTPLECEAWLRRFFDIMRIFLGINGDDETLETFERTVWDMDISAIDGVLKDRARPDLRPYADMIDLERDLLRLVTKVGEDGGKVDGDTIATEQEADKQED